METISTEYTAFSFDEQHMLYLTFDTEVNESNVRTYRNIHLYTADLVTGVMVYNYPLSEYPTDIIYTATGCILYATAYDVENTTCAYAVSLSENTFTVEEVDLSLFPLYYTRVTSPNESYIAFADIDNATRVGGIYLLSSDDSLCCILENRTAYENAIMTDSPAIPRSDLSTIRIFCTAFRHGKDSGTTVFTTYPQK